MLASVAHTDLRQDSLARVGWHEECEASVNEQIKCDLQTVHISANSQSLQLSAQFRTAQVGTVLCTMYSVCAVRAGVCGFDKSHCAPFSVCLYGWLRFLCAYMAGQAESLLKYSCL